MNTTETTAENRKLVEGIFAELERKNSGPFVEAIADDVTWRISGTSIWSRTFRGKASVLEELLGPVRAQLVERVHLTLRRVVADGDVVVVEATGKAQAKTGKPYDNQYCFVYRLAAGRIVEVTEYLDTDLAGSTLVPPWAAGAQAGRAG
jgi:hypothetical protein